MAYQGNKTKKKKMHFPNMESLDSVVKVLNESEAGLNDKTRTISKSYIRKELTVLSQEISARGVTSGAIAGGTVGVAGSYALLYFLGVNGLSAAGISSALATAGLGMGMAAGVFVVAAPALLLPAVGMGTAYFWKKKKLRARKEQLYKEVLEAREGIIKAMSSETGAYQDRLEYLNALNVYLKGAAEALWEDLKL